MTDTPRDVLYELMRTWHGPGYDARMNEAKDILAALSAKEWAIVPREPTEEMIEAAHWALTDAISMHQNNAVRALSVYRAMLASQEKRKENDDG